MVLNFGFGNSIAMVRAHLGLEMTRALVEIGFVRDIINRASRRGIFVCVRLTLSVKKIRH